jgi:hypothetical protein
VSRRKLELIVAAAVVAALVVVSAANADSTAVRDRAKETKALKRRPNLDIVRASAGHAGDELKHKVKMRGRIKPGKKNTRPFILINTKGGKRSAYEFVVVGTRVLEVRGNRLERVGGSRLSTRRRTWIYRFSPESFGAGDSYGWAALTAKGKTVDLAPNRNYKKHDLR